MTTTVKEKTQFERDMEQDKRILNYERDKESLEITKVENDITFGDKYRVDNMLTDGVYFVEEEKEEYICNCPDFKNRCSKYVPWIKCKHLLAVESWKGRKKLKKTIRDIEEVLKKKFKPEQVKQRPGSYGKLLDYLETHSVIERLNEAFGLKWSWEIVDSKILSNQIYCQGRLTVKIDKEIVIKETFGGKEVRKGSNLGDDLKSAASDALKKAATMLGVGLYLYNKDNKDNKGNNGGNGKVQVQTLKPLDNRGGLNGGNGNGKVREEKASMRQVRYIKDLCKDLRIEPKINIAALTRARASEIIEGLQKRLADRKKN